MMRRTLTSRWLLIGALAFASTGCSMVDRAVQDHYGVEHGDVSLEGIMSGRDVKTANLSIARAIERQGDYEKAAQLYEQMLKQSPGEPELMHRLAISMEKLGNQERADKLFREAIAASPKDPNILADYGYARYLAGDFEGAETALRQAAEIDPEHKRAQVNLGLVLCGMGRVEEAREAFAAADLTSWEAGMNIAFALSVGGQLDEAREAYAALRAEHPTDERIVRRLEQLDELIAQVDGAPLDAESTEMARADEAEAAFAETRVAEAAMTDEGEWRAVHSVAGSVSLRPAATSNQAADLGNSANSAQGEGVVRVSANVVPQLPSVESAGFSMPVEDASRVKIPSAGN